MVRCRPATGALAFSRERLTVGWPLRQGRETWGMHASIPMSEKRPAAQTDPIAVLVDSRGVPVCPSREALRVLLYPRDIPTEGEARRLAAQRFRSLFPDGPLSEGSASAGEFLSGRRRYLYRICRLRDSLPRGRAPAAVILLERPPWLLEPALLAPYHLTVREEQVLWFLLQGLSNKQIAESMEISANTVKAFLRLIMTKMDVTSRLGILGKLLTHTRPRGDPAPRCSAPPVARSRIAGSL
jgi:DNA-binding CsgD family transcriptional regulator